MVYDETFILIPSHSLEDFPEDLGDKQAASILNAFAVAWHPRFIAMTGNIPGWHRADEPPDYLENRLILVPLACDDWLPGGWADHARLQGATVVDGISDRGEMLSAALAPLEAPDDLDAEIVADFLALGTCWLQLELLTRRMHHFSNLDEAHLQREAVSAAEAAVANDLAAAKTHLGACFDILADARGRFYPVDCYLIDLCLLIPRLADANLSAMLATGQPANILATPTDLQQIATESPDIFAEIKEAWHSGRLDICGGDLNERATPLLPLESVIGDLHRGQQLYQKLFDKLPTTWGRRRFGFHPQLPQLLQKSGYHSALHFALDDGIYPDAEQSKIRWEGPDGSHVDAITRIPLSADGAQSYLRFPARMAEAMEEDMVAAVVFARWPEVKDPWYEDFRRIHHYAPVLGRFVTFDDFFQHTDQPGRLSQFDAREYLTPFLLQEVARRDPDPISRYTGHMQRRREYDTAHWYSATSNVLLGRAVPPSLGEVDGVDGDTVIEKAEPDADAAEVATAEKLLAETPAQAARELADVIMAQAGNQPGYLLLNPLSFERTVGVELPELQSPPARGGAVKASQCDEHFRGVTATIPPCGYAWIPAGDGASESGGAARESKKEIPLVEEGVLRNEFFEVHINEETGGIARIKEYGRNPNRISQQLAFRFPRERTFRWGEGDDAVEDRSFYSAMQRTGTKVTSTGPAMGEVITTGDLIDQKSNKRLAGFRQQVRLWRGRKVVDVTVDLDIERMPEGDPWSNYYAARFAWNDSAASLTRSVQMGAHSFVGERIESPHYFEIATEEHRTTILPMGLPFHRKTGPRMLDTLLAVEGETKHHFRFAIVLDEPYPLQAALNAMTPAGVVPTKSGPPSAGASGWFFHLSAKNVQLTRLLPLMSEPEGDRPTWEPYDAPGFAVRLVETEGRSRRTKFTCFRPPVSARIRDFHGRTLREAPIEDGTVIIDVQPCEIIDLELRFA